MSNNHYLQFIAYCLKDNPLNIPDFYDMDWRGLYEFSLQQAITGIVFDGIDRMSESQKVDISQKLLYEWIGQVFKIEAQNRLVNQRVNELTESLRKQGKRSCLLKGQGNAQMYPNPLHRLPGDIDIWLDGSKELIVDFVHERFPNMNVQYHHMNYPVFNDVDVEVHYYPSFCFNKWNNHWLQTFFKEESESQFKSISKEGYAVPTVFFNLVFQLSHMMRHFFTQGIGLRHAIDYYYLLKQDITKEEKEKVVKVLKRCGMYKFFCAVLWIEVEVLGLDRNIDIAPYNRKAGIIILREMLKGGNLGHSYKHNQNKIILAYASQMIYSIQYICEFPSEPLSRPIALVWDYINKHLFGN